MSEQTHQKKPVTVVIPALDEEKNITNTYLKVKSALENLGLDYEIILFNDGSRDKTGEIIESIRLQNSQVKTVHHKTPKGMGFAYKTGIEMSQKTYFLLMPGDDDFEEYLIRRLLESAGKADIIIPFFNNFQSRPWHRKIFSAFFTRSLNFLFNLDLTYYNGPVLHLTKNLKALKITSNKFTYQAEILLKLIKLKKCTYDEIGLATNERIEGKSKAVRLANFIDVGSFMVKMLFEIYCRK